jgi:hypothetical protein
MARSLPVVDPWETFRKEWREMERLYGGGRSAEFRPLLDGWLFRLDEMGDWRHPLVVSTRRLIDEMGDPDRLRIRLVDVKGKLVQAIGEWEARRNEEREQRVVEDYRYRRLGYDYISHNPTDEADYHKIEVKGRGHGGGDAVRVPSRMQWEAWTKDRQHYWFYPVADCLTKPRVKPIPPDRIEWPRRPPTEWFLPRPKRRRVRTLGRETRRPRTRRRNLGTSGIA